METDCVNNGKFLVMEELRDRTHNIPTGLRIHLSYSYKDQLSAQGEALVVKNFNTDNEGQLSNTWEVRSLKLANLSDGDPRSIELLLEEISEAAHVANGSSQVVKFNVKRFSLQRELRKLGKELPDNPETECTFENYVSTQDSLDTLSGNGWLEEDTSTVPLLEKLQQKGLILHIIGRGLAEGETECCSYYYFRVFTTDGWVLELDYDFTS